jgi:hypothetical protein
LKAAVRDEEINTIKDWQHSDKCDVSLDTFQIGQNHIGIWPFITQEATVQEIKTPIMF